MAGVKLKSKFRVESRISAFYTGGEVCLSSDGQHIFCVHGAIINIVDTTSGKVVHSIKEEDGDDVTSFAVTPDDEFLVVAHRNLLLKQWDWKEERCVRTWKAIHSAPIRSMTFDPTSTLLATGSSDRTIKIWDIVRQYCTHNLKGSEGVVNLVKFHPDSDKLLLFSASDSCKIRVWDLQTSRCKAVLESHYSAVTSFAFTTDGQTMYSSGRDNIVTVWNLDSYKAKKTIPVYEPLERVLVLPTDVDCSKVGVHEKEPCFVTAGSKGLLKVWNAVTGQCLFTQREQLPRPAQAEAQPGVKGQQQVTAQIDQALLCPALGVVAVVTYDHNILLFGLKDFELQKQFVGYNEEIFDLCFMGEGDTHIAVASNSEQIRVFELSSLSCQILPGHTDIVLALQTFRKGLILLSSSKDNTVRLWSMDPSSGCVSCVAIGKGHTHSVGAVATARLSSKFFASGSEDCTIKVWDVPSSLPSGKSTAPLPLHVKFTERAHEKDINSIAISPNDKLLATGSQDKTAKLWHLEKETSLGSFRGHKRGLWCVQFSPTDQALATSSADGTIKIWALSDFSCVKTFEGHDASVLKVTFLSKGMQLASCGSDGLLKLWTIKSNECVGTLDEHSLKVWALAASRGQHLLVSGGADSNILIWKDITEIEQEEEIAKEEDQILKEQELSNLLHGKKYLKAIGLAITLNQPFRVLTIMKNILDEPQGQQNLEKTLKKMRQDQIESVLGFCKHWNTNSKHCHAAQAVIAIVLRHFGPDDLLTFTSMQQTLEGLIPYTERHFERMNRLLQQAMFVEYTWQRMRRATGPVDSGMVVELDDKAGASESGPSFTIDTTPSALTPPAGGNDNPGQRSEGEEQASSDEEEETTAEEGREEAENGEEEEEEEEEDDDSEMREEVEEAVAPKKAAKQKSEKRKKRPSEGSSADQSPHKSGPDTPPQKRTPKLRSRRSRAALSGERRASIGSDGTTDEPRSDDAFAEDAAENQGKGMAIRTRSRDPRLPAPEAALPSPGVAKKRAGKAGPAIVKAAKKAKVAGRSKTLSA